MSDEPKQPTFSAREIVLEFFPATHERLIPARREFTVERDSQGSLQIVDSKNRTLLHFQPVDPSGNPTTQLCCDLCGWNGTRHHLNLYRGEVPGSGGRRFRYLTACQSGVDCEARRFSDESVSNLLQRD